MITSGSALCNVTRKNGLIETIEKKRTDVLSKLLRSIRSFFMGEMNPFALDFALASKFGGKRSNGRTKVLTVQGRASGGVGSSMATAREFQRLGFVKMGVKHALLCQILAVAQTISRIFSWWFTMVRILKLTTVSGGVSIGAFGSVSARGLISFGSDTVASILHHDT